MPSHCSDPPSPPEMLEVESDEEVGDTLHNIGRHPQSAEKKRDLTCTVLLDVMLFMDVATGSVRDARVLWFKGSHTRGRPSRQSQMPEIGTLRLPTQV